VSCATGDKGFRFGTESATYLSRALLSTRKCLAEHERDARVLSFLRTEGRGFGRHCGNPQSIVQSRATRSAGIPRRLGRAVAFWSGRGGRTLCGAHVFAGESEMQKGSSIVGAESFLASGEHDLHPSCQSSMAMMGQGLGLCNIVPTPLGT